MDSWQNRIYEIAPKAEWGTPFMELLRKMFENAGLGASLEPVGREAKLPSTWDVMPSPLQYMHLSDEEVGMLCLTASLLAQWKEKHDARDTVSAEV